MARAALQGLTMKPTQQKPLPKSIREAELQPAVGPSRIKLRHVLPSLVTVFAICAGLTSVRMSFEGNLTMALYLIVLAILLDGADGKLARYLDTASPFGAELDTLADFFNFGIAPGFLIFNTFYLSSPFENLGWLVCLTLAVCCALRLARFNISLGEPPKAKGARDFFVGVPAPALACLSLMPAFLYLGGWEGIANQGVAIAIYIGFVAGLAISTLPTFSIKHASLPRQMVPLFVLGAVITIMVLVAYPWQTLVVANLAYLASIPVSYRQAQRG
jgi:CDP-diacylglycerol--serine O-phosphatidyltransferase